MQLKNQNLKAINNASRSHQFHRQALTRQSNQGHRLATAGEGPL